MHPGQVGHARQYVLRSWLEGVSLSCRFGSSSLTGLCLTCEQQLKDQNIFRRNFNLPNRDGIMFIRMYLPASTIDDVDSFLALTVHFGFRLFEDHTPSPGPVCISLGLQLHEVNSINPMSEVKGVAHTALLDECLGMPEKEHTRLVG